MKSLTNNTMISANELRIGNWLKRADGSLFQVTAEDILIISKTSNPFAVLPEPIILTEKMLSDAEFEYFVCWKLKGFKVWYSSYAESFLIRFNFVGSDLETMLYFKHVHELQNIYFYFMNEELNILK